MQRLHNKKYKVQQKLLIKTSYCKVCKIRNTCLHKSHKDEIINLSMKWNACMPEPIKQKEINKGGSNLKVRRKVVKHVLAKK